MPPLHRALPMGDPRRVRRASPPAAAAPYRHRHRHSMRRTNTFPGCDCTSHRCASRQLRIPRFVLHAIQVPIRALGYSRSREGKFKAEPWSGVLGDVAAGGTGSRVCCSTYTVFGGCGGGTEGAAALVPDEPVGGGGYGLLWVEMGCCHD